MMQQLSTWIFLFLIGLVPMAPRAQTAENQTKAQAYLDLATTLFRKGDHQGALEELKRAQPLIEDPKITALVHFNIARCYEELGMAIHAMQAYRTYLGNGEEIPRRTKRAESFIERVKNEYMGDAEVKCSPEAATVRIVELRRASKSCPARFSELPIGKYTVLVEADGHRSVRRPIEVTAATVSTEDITLVLGRDHESAENTLGPTIAEVEAVSEEFYTSPAFLMTAAGGTAVATGFVTHLIALQSRASIEDDPPGAERNERLNAFETQRTVTLLGYGIGGALLGVGLYLMFEDELGLTQNFIIAPNGAAAIVHF